MLDRLEGGLYRFTRGTGPIYILRLIMASVTVWPLSGQSLASVWPVSVCLALVWHCLALFDWHCLTGHC